MIIVDMEKSAAESRCVMVGLQMDCHGRELVVHAISKVAREGDRVVAVHVSRTSELGSTSSQALIKALDNFLSAYQGLCNLNQVVLAGRLARGTSVRKVLVKEAASCSAATVVVGLNNNCSLSGSASVAKYCAKKLRPATALIAVQNGKVIFERAATKSLSGGEAGKPNIRSILHPSVGMDTEAIIPITETPKSSDAVPEEGWNDRHLVVHGTTTTPTGCDSSSSITLLVRRLPEPNVGWPLLRRAVRANAEPLKETEPHNLSVVEWVMNLPDRSTACSTPPSAPTDLINDLEAILQKNSSTCKWFQHGELQSSTDQFSAEKLIGKGGSSQVFMGDLPDGPQVAIKLSELSDETSGAFLSEVDIITTLRHEHIVPLIGICVEHKSSLSMIYDYFPRGSLEENLHGKRSKSPLSWEMRFKVAVGVAEGLNYLHCGTSRQVIHRDIKSSNILLTEEYEPQISDFGLAMWAPTDKSFETQNDIVGTFGYLAPEYFMYGKVSDKIDVYAYGVVLLELLTGRKPISDERPKGQESLVVWATRGLQRGDVKEILDSDLDGNCDEDQIRRLVLIATLCIRRSARLRPQMSQVLMLLKGDDEIDPWIALGASSISSLGEQDYQDDEACHPVSSVGSHLSLALLDVEEDDASTISFEQNNLSSLDEYLRERWSRSPSFD